MKTLDSVFEFVYSIMCITMVGGVTIVVAGMVLLFLYSIFSDIRKASGCEKDELCEMEDEK